jgi:hypothetical protein
MSWIAHVNLTFERLALQNTDASLEGNYIHLKFYPGCDKLEQKRPRHRTLSETTRPKQIQCGLGPIDRSAISGVPSVKSNIPGALRRRAVNRPRRAEHREYRLI